MKFEKDYLFHVYNRGNNRNQIFYRAENYLFFLKKIRKEILPHCEILAYCLMPNHFHFLIYANERTIKTVLKANQKRNVFSEGIRIVLSTYTQAINKQEGRVGSLFTQNTVAKPLSDNSIRHDKVLNRNMSVDYSINCFQYIHQNPLKARLVTKMEDWPYSSYSDYCGYRNGTLCNQELTRRMINLDWENFYKQSYIVLDNIDTEGIW